MNHFQVLASDADISGLYNPAKNMTYSKGSQVLDLVNKSGFNVLEIVFFVVGLIFFGNFVVAGWDYMLSSGDPKKVAVASSRMTNGLMGLVIVITSYLLVKIVVTILGLGTTI